METIAADRPADHWAPPEEAASLIRRYPRISDQELERLLSIFPRLPRVHVALMSSDDELASRIEAFRTDHRRRLRTPPAHLAALLSPVFLLLIVLAWLALK